MRNEIKQLQQKIQNYKQQNERIKKSDILSVVKMKHDNKNYVVITYKDMSLDIGLLE